jgi:hypothetical protein
MGHLGRHYGHELHVGFERHGGHVGDAAGDVLDIDARLGLDPARRLQAVARGVLVARRRGEQASEHPDRVNGERVGARKIPEPDGGDEQQRPNQVGDGAGEAYYPRATNRGTAMASHLRQRE